MANFLTLTNIALGRINEVQLNSVTFSSASGPQLVMQTAINAAISDINRRYQQWPFNYDTQTFNTQASTKTTTGSGYIYNEYTPADGVTVIKWSTFGIARNDTSTPPIVASTLTEVDYNLWAATVRPLDLQMSVGQFAQPRYVIKGDDGNIILSPPPDTVYTIYYDAWSDPPALVNYGDTCSIPDKYNYVIVDGAMYYGYDFRSDINAQDRAKAKFDMGVQEMLRELVKPTTGFQSTLIQNQQYYNSIPSRYGL
jgi:hypothetical protein